MASEKSSFVWRLIILQVDDFRKIHVGSLESGRYSRILLLGLQEKIEVVVEVRIEAFGFQCLGKFSRANGIF